MSVAEELKPKLANNDHFVYITDADDLLAAWRHRRENKFKRSFDFTSVPTEYRLSAPPNEKAPCMPCHVTIRRKLSQVTRTIQPAPELSTIDCHGHGRTVHISVTDLDALESVAFARRNVAPYVTPILDAGTLALVCKDLGINARAIPRVIDNRQYIAFTGYPGLRSRFPGTIYSAKNSKLIKMGIGALGIRNMVKNGGMLTICLTVPLTILECYMRDPKSLAAFAGNVASDLIKVGISSIIGAIAGIAIGGVTTFVAVPIVVTIFVGAFAGLVLNRIDNEYQLTEKLVSSLEQMGDELHKMSNQAETYIYRGMSGFIRSHSSVRSKLAKNVIIN